MNLLERIRSHALHQGNDDRFFFLDGAARVRDSFSYAKLDAVAASLAAGLMAHGLGGQRIVLLMSPGCEFLFAFIGCLYAGAIPVPVAVPGTDNGAARWQVILRNCQPQAVLVDTPALLERATAAGAGVLPAVPIVQWSDFLSAPGVTAAPLPAYRGDALAFLQYSSGSTASPKGIMVTHANLADNLQCIIAKCRVGRDSRCLTWLPHFHDMGLIGGLLTPMYAGATCRFMTPMDFAKHPLSWLRAASCWRSTYTGAPNFAYEACASLAEENPDLQLDLRSLESCACGAEPISASSIRRFFSAYARHGLRPASFFPCYGMSECTVMACSAGVGESGLDLLQTFDRMDMDAGHAAALPGASGSIELVSSGTPVAGHDVIVVDPSCQPCPDGVTGEIWIAGPSVAAGYWNDPGQTAASFGARTSVGEGPYLRSGDLGFFHDGRLFVTGRTKDLIIIRGRKLYPQDIEYPVGRCHPQLRPGISAAFSIVSDAGVKGMALVQAVKPARDPMLYAVIAQQIRALILQQHGVALDALILTRARDIPQTTSGKVQRQLCRSRYLSGELHPLYQMDWPS